MFCKKCGKEVSEEATVCMHCGVAVPQKTGKQRIVYILLGVFLGSFGAHNFYAGYIGRAVTQLAIALLLLALYLWGLIIPIVAVSIWVIFEICTVQNDANGNKLG